MASAGQQNGFVHRGVFGEGERQRHRRSGRRFIVQAVGDASTALNCVNKAWNQTGLKALFQCRLELDLNKFGDLLGGNYDRKSRRIGTRRSHDRWATLVGAERFDA
jgi:hypothetical protein